jgi:predicted nucleic acid-binding protein
VGLILVDANIPMYLIGDDERRRSDARRALEDAVADGEALCSDAEVLQEILHRYVAIDRRDKIEPAFDALLGVVDIVYPVELADLERARRLVLTSRLSARDAIHIAVMQGRDIGRVMSFDRGFDGIPGIVRLGP